MIYTIQQEGKHQFLHTLSQNTTRGLLGKALRGEWPSGKPPFGYKVEKTPRDRGVSTRLVLADDVETSLVVRMFDECDAGATLRGLRDQLNAEGKNPRTGSAWSEKSIRHILRTPLYTGDFVWPRNSYGRYSRVRNGQVSSEKGDIGEQIIIRDNHPSLIDRDQFERVGKKWEENRKATTPHINGGGFLLTGLLYCKNCGHKMYGITDRSGKTPRIYYRCSGANHYGESVCSTNNVPQDKLLSDVVEAIQTWATDPDTVAGFDGVLDGLVQEATSVDATLRR